MLSHIALRGWTIVLLSTLSAAQQIITVTEHLSACSAVYTSGSSSVTVIQSTVTVSPIPIATDVSDQQANSGTPFLIQVLPGIGSGGSKSKRAQSATYMTANGYTTTNISEAVQYEIQNEMLTSTTGGWITTAYGIDNETFALAPVIGPINTVFEVRNGSLGWRNPAFDNGISEFFMIPTGDGTEQVIVKFLGTVSPTWMPISFAPKVAPQQSAGVASQSLGSTTVSTIIHVGSMSIPPSATPPYDANGVCGSSNGLSCMPGKCCSQYGYCGVDPEYCEAGCQPEYGVCNVDSITLSTSVATSRATSTSATPSTSRSGYITIRPPFYSVPPSSLSFDSSIASPRSSTATPAASSSEPSPPPSSSASPGASSVSSSTSTSISTTTLSIFGSTANPIGPIGPSGTLPMTYSISTAESSSISSAVFLSSSNPSSPLSAVPSISSTGLAASSASTSGVSVSILSSLQFSMSSASVTASSSIQIRSTSDTSARITSTSISVASSVTASSASPTATQPSCPANNHQAVKDSNGLWYTIGCGEDTDGELLEVTQAPSSFNDCFTPCDAISGCLGFTYSGGANGTGPGNCYLKKTDGGRLGFGGTGSGLVAAIMNNPAAASSVISSMVRIVSTSTSASSAMSSTSLATVTSSSSTGSASTVSQSSASVSTTSPASMTTTISSIAVVSLASLSSLSSSSTTTSSLSSSYLVLTSPTPCNFGDPAGMDEDDSYCEIDVPSAIAMYNARSTRTFASSNGYISIGYGSSQYEAQSLPDSFIPNNTVAPFFDDLYIYGMSSPQQGIFYQVTPDNVTFEYYVARAGEPDEIYHFTVAYSYTVPGVFTYRYYSVGGSDQGQFAAVGMQGLTTTGTPTGFTYSLQANDITVGLVVSCNTQANTCNTVSS